MLRETIVNTPWPVNRRAKKPTTITAKAATQGRCGARAPPSGAAMRSAWLSATSTTDNASGVSTPMTRAPKRSYNFPA